MSDLSLIGSFMTEDSILIACDSGLNHVYGAGLVPDVIIGDFDSVSPKVLEHYRAMGKQLTAYPVKKDSTDTELGIFTAVERGADDIILLAASGTRLDHTLANIQIMLPLLKKGIRARLTDEHNTVELIDKSLTVNNKNGGYISLLPLTERVEGITTKGLEYPLDNADIEMGTSLTVSNVIVSDEAHITVKNGVLAVITAVD